MAERETIAKVEAETKLQHRALVLYSMQDEDRRSLRATAKAVARAESVLRGWVKTYRWKERIEGEGITVQARACQLYRELYHGEWRLRDVAGDVEARMSVPVLSMAPVPVAGKPGEGTAQVIAEERETIGQARGKTGISANEMSPRAIAEKELRAQRSLVQRLVKEFADRLQGKAAGPKPSITARDLPTFLRVYREISETLDDLGPGTATPTSLETSFRVREAERLGTNTTEALLADVDELRTILQTMLDAEDRDPAWLEPAHPARHPKAAKKAADDEVAEG